MDHYGLYFLDDEFGFNVAVDVNSTGNTITPMKNYVVVKHRG